MQKETFVITYNVFEESVVFSLQNLKNKIQSEYSYTNNIFRFETSNLLKLLMITDGQHLRYSLTNRDFDYFILYDEYIEKVDDPDSEHDFYLFGFSKKDRYKLKDEVKIPDFKTKLVIKINSCSTNLIDEYLFKIFPDLINFDEMIIKVVKFGNKILLKFDNKFNIISASVPQKNIKGTRIIFPKILKINAPKTQIKDGLVVDFNNHLNMFEFKKLEL